MRPVRILHFKKLDPNLSWRKILIQLADGLLFANENKVWEWLDVALFSHDHWGLFSSHAVSGFWTMNAIQSTTLMWWCVAFRSPMHTKSVLLKGSYIMPPAANEEGTMHAKFASQMDDNLLEEYNLASCSDRARVSAGFADNAVGLPIQKNVPVYFYECSPSRQYSILGLSFVLRNKNIDWKALDGAFPSSLSSPCCLSQV